MTAFTAAAFFPAARSLMALLKKVAKIKVERGGRTVASLEEEVHRKQNI